MRGRALWGKALILLCASSCLSVYRDRPPAIGPDDPRYDAIVQVRFLGVDGFLIRKGADALMTAPMYSNPTIDEVLSPELFPSPDAIARFHPAGTHVKAILVGHAHYDHLMDVPYVWQQSPEATIYGNATMKNILAGFAFPPPEGSATPYIPDEKVVALNANGSNIVDSRMCSPAEVQVPSTHPCLEQPPTEGRWVHVPDSRIRIRALCSRHPPQFLGTVHLWTGCVATPREWPPDKAADYLEGSTLAYLIDFLDANGRPLFRIYYHDAPATSTTGQIHPDILAEKAVDLAILCVGNFDTVPDATYILTATSPRYVILGHWEDFFRPQDSPLQTIPFAPVRDVVREIKESLPETSQVWLPAPQAAIHLPLSETAP